MSFVPLDPLDNNGRSALHPSPDTPSLLNADDDAAYDGRSLSSTTRLRTRDSDDNSITKTSSRPTSVLNWRRLSGTPAWEHKLNEDHIDEIAPESDTIRYFDRSRQTRRVLVDGLWMWLGTALTCAGIAVVLVAFGALTNGVSKWERYLFNTLINGLLLVLGIAFAAQFKQYCEMMRWRFLASDYRTLAEFEEVLDCDSWRTAVRLMFRRGKGRHFASKSRILAIAWILIFTAFNVFAALIGLTYGLDPGPEGHYSLLKGTVSIMEMDYLSLESRAESDPELAPLLQLGPANYWGQVGHHMNATLRNISDPVENLEESTVFYEPGNATWWYRFIDTDPATRWKRASSRTISSTATCIEFKLSESVSDSIEKQCARLLNESMTMAEVREFFREKPFCEVWGASSALRTSWISNYTALEEIADPLYCGSRCTGMYVLQSLGTRELQDVVHLLGQMYVPNLTESRLWKCKNTVGEVQVDMHDYESRDAVTMPDAQAAILAGSIAWSDQLQSGGGLLFREIMGDFGTGYNLGNEATESLIAALIMKFTVGAIAAMDQQRGPRKQVRGLYPRQPLLLSVKWKQAAPMLIGIPLTQLLMLFAVVRFSGKAIILEPSYLTIARLFQPAMQKLGTDGALMTSDEISAALGPRFKVAYGVRPHPRNHTKASVKELALVEESEGFGYIRGRMPEGRYA